MSSKATHILRSHKTNGTPIHKSVDIAFHPGNFFPKFSKQNKNKNRWPSLEDRFGRFNTKEQLAQRIAASYEKESADE